MMINSENALISINKSGRVMKGSKCNGLYSYICEATPIRKANPHVTSKSQD